MAAVKANSAATGSKSVRNSLYIVVAHYNLCKDRCFLRINCYIRTMIRLSLIIPTHNRSERLIAALESVIRQDLPAADWECVVVSNN